MRPTRSAAAPSRLAAAVIAAAVVLTACSPVADDDHAPVRYGQALAEELGISEDELAAASTRARDRVLEERAQQARDAGLTADELTRRLDDLGLTDPDRREEYLTEAERHARTAGDAVARELEERLTEESAERTANWLVRTGERLAGWFRRTTDEMVEDLQTPTP